MSDPDPTTEPTTGPTTGPETGQGVRRDGRRDPARSRPVVALVLAVLLPLGSVGALLAVAAPPPETAVERAPQESPLTRATLVCPGLDAPVSVGTTTRQRGVVTLRAGARSRALEVRPRRLASSGLGADGARAVTVTGLDDLAPGLLAGRFPAGGRPTSPACSPPVPGTWFTGLGAGARHASVLALTNPDRGSAVVDIEVHGERGPVEVPALRGLAVPGRRTVRLDLAAIVPRRDTLSAHVTTSRGRVVTAAQDRVGLIGDGPRAVEWLPAQAEPATSSLLLGLAPGRGERSLVLTNPTDDEARAAVRVVTRRSTFSPQGVEDVLVPAGATVSVDLSGVLGRQVLRTAVGLQVDATGPVTAAVRTLVDGDLALLAATPALTEHATALVLPAGAKRLVVAGASSTGSVTALARSERGRRLALRRADLGAGRASVVALPAATRLLEVSVRGTTVAGSVLVTAGGARGGAAVVPLVDLERRGLVGDVRPARR